MHYFDPSLYPSRSGNELLLSLSLSFSFLTGNLEHLVMGYYFGKKNEKKKDSGDQRDRYPPRTFFNFFVLLKINKHLEKCHMLFVFSLRVLPKFHMLGVYSKV